MIYVGKLPTDRTQVSTIDNWLRDAGVGPNEYRWLYNRGFPVEGIAFECEEDLIAYKLRYNV